MERGKIVTHYIWWHYGYFSQIHSPLGVIGNYGWRRAARLPTMRRRALPAAHWALASLEPNGGGTELALRSRMSK